MRLSVHHASIGPTLGRAKAAEDSPVGPSVPMTYRHRGAPSTPVSAASAGATATAPVAAAASAFAMNMSRSSITAVEEQICG